MDYRCQPIQADHYCLKCQRYTTEQADSVFVALGSQDESCGYLPSDGSKRVVNMREIAFRTYEEVK